VDKIDHLMAEKNENNKDSQKGQVTPKNILKKVLDHKTNYFSSKPFQIRNVFLNQISTYFISKFCADYRIWADQSSSIISV
jgi:hypothetical protein